MVLREDPAHREAGSALEKIVDLLAAKIRREVPDFDYVVSPAYGAIAIGFLAALKLGKKFAFTQRADEKMTIRSGFSGLDGSQAVIVEDILTTGGSIQEVLACLQEHQVPVAGIYVLVDRSGGVRAHRGQARRQPAGPQGRGLRAGRLPLLRQGTAHHQARRLGQEGLTAACRSPKLVLPRGRYRRFPQARRDRQVRGPRQDGLQLFDPDWYRDPPVLLLPGQLIRHDIERRDDDQAQGRRQDQAADDGDGHGHADLGARADAQRRRDGRHHGRRGRHQDGPQPDGPGLLHGLARAEALLPERVGVVDQDDGVLLDDAHQQQQADHAEDVQATGA
ncbi:MAG: hypothetical protein MZU79_04490 [Anaerotruncus sp.]|nr:hypothetical protein [Anaerotruncus sp.]